MQLPQDAAQYLPVVTPWLATSATGGQQRPHPIECVVGKFQYPAASWLWLQERDAKGQHHHQQPSAAVVLG
jgi:hypothetical protein